MAAAPSWFTQLTWSPPATIAQINLDRALIPDFPGCYAFTVGPVPIAPGRVLYVGEAKASLRGRICSYLVDWTKPKLSENHKGKGFVLEARAAHTDFGVHLRWVEYGGAGPDISLLESSLIDYLVPTCNDRDESVRHGVLGDWERLDSRLLR